MLNDLMQTGGGASAPPRISVVVPHLNEPEMLTRCLSALQSQTAGIAYEIIVVDNGSRERPEALCARYPGVRLEYEPTPGPGPARNRGASLARGEILAFIDADCFADPHWLAALADHFDKHPEIDFLGGDIGIAAADAAGMTAIEAYEAVFSYRAEMFVRQQGFAATGNMAVRRAVFEAVGPFEGIGVHEDRRWGHKAVALGHRLGYAPAVLVRTPACASFAALRKRMDIHIAHDLSDANFGGLGGVRWLLKSLLMVASPVAELPRILRSDKLHGSRERGLALLCLARIRLYRAMRMLDALLSRRVAAKLATWNR